MTVLIVVLAVAFFAGAAVGFVAWAFCKSASMGEDMGDYQRRERRGE